MATAESVKAKAQGMIDEINNRLGGDFSDLKTAISAFAEERNNFIVGSLNRYYNGDVTSIRIDAMVGLNVAIIELPSVTELGSNCFNGSKVVYAKLDSYTGESGGIGAFYNCSNLAEVYIPALVAIPQGFFRQCPNLSKSVDFERITEIGIQGFAGAKTLLSGTVEFPNLISTNRGAMENCTGLECAIIGQKYTTAIASQCFKGCTALKTLVLRSETYCPIASVNVFDGTPFASGGPGGTVYVPTALIEEYQNDTNWSALYAEGTCNFAAIEGSEYE